MNRFSVRIALLLLLMFATGANGGPAPTFLLSDSPHRGLEELILLNQSAAQDLNMMTNLLRERLSSGQVEELEAFLKERDQRRAVLVAEAEALFQPKAGRDPELVFYSCDPESDFGRKFSVYRKTNNLRLKEILGPEAYLVVRSGLREINREQRIAKAEELLDGLKIEMPPEARAAALEIFAGRPSFLPRSGPETLATGFSGDYLLQREQDRLRLERDYLDRKLREVAGAEDVDAVTAWYDANLENLDMLLFGQRTATNDESVLAVVVQTTGGAIPLKAEKTRVFLDCFEEGVALVPMEQINFLARSVLRSYSVQSRGDHARLRNFLLGRDLLVGNYRVELDYLRTGLVYMTRENPWYRGDLLRTRDLERMMTESAEPLDEALLEFVVLARDGSDAQFQALEFFLAQHGFTVTRRALGDDEVLPILLPGLDGAP